MKNKNKNNYCTEKNYFQELHNNILLFLIFGK